MSKRESFPGAQPFSIFFIDGIIVGDWVGTPTVEAVRASIEEAMAMPDFRTGMPVMAQFREGTAAPEVGQIMQIAAEMAAYRGQIGPTALVVSSQQHAALARVLSTYCRMSGVHVEVFGKVQDAFAWLRHEMAQQPPRAKAGDPAQVRRFFGY